MKYTSNAEWPKECGVSSSSDTHDTREAAEAVCRLLENNGFGGGGIYFPTRTWVQPPEEAPGGEELLNKILSASFDGCNERCLHCGEVNELASRGLGSFRRDRNTLQECLDATRVQISQGNQVIEILRPNVAPGFLNSLEDVVQGLAITAAKLEEVLK